MSKSLFDLSGKVALVTGSTRGIGKSVAEELARAGAKVVISSRKAEACEKTRAELAAQDFDVMAQPCNVSRREDLKALVDAAREKWQRIAVTPLRRIGDPRDIGGIAVFLASDAAAFITGQVIVADGGVTIL